MTVRVVAQLVFVDGVDEVVRRRAIKILSGLGEAEGKVAGVVAMHAGLHTESSVGGGDLTWDLLFRDEARVASLFGSVGTAGSEVAGILGALLPAGEETASLFASIEAGVPQTMSGHLGRPNLVGIKRTLWLRVIPGTDPEALAQFEAEAPLLAAAVPAIRNWRWSRLRSDLCLPGEGGGWTHLWEQEFEGLPGLEVDYMSSPCHWGFIDRWFDPEMPDQIVDIRLAHLACRETAPVLSWGDLG